MCVVPLRVCFARDARLFRREGTQREGGIGRSIYFSFDWTLCTCHEIPSANVKPQLLGRMGTWNEELAIPLDVGEAQSCLLQIDVLDATLREEGLKACTFRLDSFIPWNGYHLNVRKITATENISARVRIATTLFM